MAIDNCNYGRDVLGDCPFTCCPVLLPLFPIEQASKILPGQVCVTWHSCPADNVEKKEQYGSLRMVKILDYNIQE